TACLASKDPPLVMTSATALGRIGPDAREVAPALVGVLGHSDYEVRQSAVTALGQIGAGAEVVPKLRPLLRDKAERTRLAPAEALYRLDPKNSDSLPALRGLLKSTDSLLRRDVVEAQGRIGAPARAALRAATDDPEEEIREAAEAALERLDRKK